MVTATSQDELLFPKGTIIFRQGDPGDQMFVISAGRVRLTLGTGSQQKEIAVFGPGEFFGELALLGGAARTATAEAIEDTTLLAIGRDAFAMMVQDDLEIVFRMMDAQGKRLSRTNEPIQALLQHLERMRIASACLRRVWENGSQWPCAVPIVSLADSLGLSSEEVGRALSDLVQRGVGELRDDRWNLHGPEQLGKLIETLCSYADVEKRERAERR